MKYRIIDFGQNTAYVFDPHSDTVGKITPEQLLFDLPLQLPSGTTIVAENAHLGCPQTKYSKAQWFTAKQLLDFYALCKSRGITIKLFPEQLTNRARNRIDLMKDSNENDLRAIWKFICDYPNVPLKNSVETFELHPTRQEGYDFKSKTNDILNITRGMGNQGYFLEDNMLSQFIVQNLDAIAQSLSEDAKDAFGLTDNERYKRGDKAGQFKLGQVKFSQIYTIGSALMDFDGNPRLRESTGKLPGWKFVKQHVFCMTPFHLRGGVARSNLYHHGAKNYIIRKVGAEIKGKKRGGKRDKHMTLVPDSDFTQKQEEGFLEARRTYMKATKEVFVAIKKQMEFNPSSNS